MKKRRAKVFTVENMRRAFRAWLTQHAQAFVFSLGQMCKNPLGSLLTTAVIGISLALPAGFYIVLENAQRLTGSWDGAVQITLFLKTDVEDSRARALAEELGQLEEIEDVRYISRNEALAEYQRISGFGNVMETLDENPLPAVLLLQPRMTSLSAAQSEKLQETLSKLPEVDAAQFDRQWIKRLFAILEILQRFVFILASMLAVAVLLIVGNTIRLAIYNRRVEIEINKLFGATDSFIQRPFLYNGLIHGIGGSIMAWLLLVASVFLLDGPIRSLAGMYHSNFELLSLNLQETLVLLLAGAILGLAGSWLSVQRHLKAIDPA